MAIKRCPVALLTSISANRSVKRINRLATVGGSTTLATGAGSLAGTPAGECSLTESSAVIASPFRGGSPLFRSDMLLAACSLRQPIAQPLHLGNSSQGSIDRYKELLGKVHGNLAVRTLCVSGRHSITRKSLKKWGASREVGKRRDFQEKMRRRASKAQVGTLLFGSVRALLGSSVRNFLDGLIDHFGG